MPLFSYFFITVFQFSPMYCGNSSNVDNITAIIEKFETSWAMDDWKKFGFFADDYVTEINLHWLKYPPPNNSSFYVLAVLYIIIMIFGVTGNFLVVYLFVKCKSLRTSGNKLIVNLAVSDCLMTMKTPIFIYNSFLRGPALGDIACRIYGFLGGLTGTTSIITLTLISFDRYFVIRFPLNRSFSDIRVKICLVVTWIYGGFFASIPVLDIGFGKYTYEGYLTSCSFDYLTEDPMIKHFIIAFFFAAWVVPLTLISFSYINIMKVVSDRATSQKRGTDSFRHVKEEDSKKQEIKLALIVFSTIILWFLSWTPYATVALLGVSGQKNLITPLTSMIPALSCKAASCVNSYVYALSHPKFKTELRKLFCRSLKRKTTDKVWTTECTKSETNIDLSVSKDDVTEIQNSTSTLTFEEATNTNVDDSRGRTLKKQETVVEMICLRPSFSNRSTSLRKLARRWSSKEKKKYEDDDENSTVDVVPVECE